MSKSGETGKLFHGREILGQVGEVKNSLALSGSIPESSTNMGDLMVYVKAETGSSNLPSSTNSHEDYEPLCPDSPNGNHCGVGDFDPEGHSNCKTCCHCGEKETISALIDTQGGKPAIAADGRAKNG